MKKNRAFTLAELLIVMGIIVLAITLAIPAIRAMTGSRSLEAARNTLQAFLARARTDAIGLQRVEGVLFFIDPATQRVTCVEVIEVPPTTSPPAPQPIDRDGIVYLDVASDRDTMVLPAGVIPMTMKDSGPPGNAGMYAGNRYLGFNSAASNPQQSGNYVNNTTAIGGAILFDAEGRAISRSYGLHLIDVTVAPNGGVTTAVSAMGRLAGFATTPRNDWPSPNLVPQWLRSQLMLALVDREQLHSVVRGVSSGSSDAAIDGNDPSTATVPIPGGGSATPQQFKEQWIDQNATPIFVNRYSGTLMRAE